ncbi:hypothetical protein [Actinacidiphila paucisporea]|uniref:Vegetative cell wall protein gp1 n=1 Tax=Actinacidiphila paucisporea TaxID=310782 RepID=A0A1M7PQ95_9ACTN|nr:hypothetical protein [Actinacidiphila paucisporea]SHN19577.1 hypothetical protein SAMN05216499_1259 [Actinacidiphila paucisporea]
MWAYGEHPRAWRDLGTPEALLWTAGALYAIGVRRHGGWQHLPHEPAAWIRAAVLTAGAATAAVLARRILSRYVADLFLGRRHQALLRPWFHRRLRRWEEADRLAVAHAHDAAGPRHAAARNRVALARPRSATWMGDRLQAVESRVRAEYGLDLPSAWPRLWLLLPAPDRDDLRAADRAWLDATDSASWALLSLVPALAWYPLTALSLLTWLGALLRARAAVEAAADLVEAAVDLHGQALARRLGAAPAEEVQVTPAIGREVNSRLRKGG